MASNYKFVPIPPRRRWSRDRIQTRNATDGELCNASPLNMSLNWRWCKLLWGLIMVGHFETNWSETFLNLVTHSSTHWHFFSVALFPEIATDVSYCTNLWEWHQWYLLITSIYFRLMLRTEIMQLLLCLTRVKWLSRTTMMFLTCLLAEKCHCLFFLPLFFSTSKQGTSLALCQ